MQDYRPLGEILIAKGKLTQEQLESALLVRHGQRRRLGDLLVSMGYVSEYDIAEGLGEQYSLEVVDVAKLAPDPIALRILDAESAFIGRVLPLRFVENNIECIIADPIDISAMDMISHVTTKHVIFRITPMSALLDAIRRAYGLSKVDRREKRSDRRITRRREEREALLALIDSELGWDLLGREDGVKL
jgi:type IV pilus assembly protein PilB